MKRNLIKFVCALLIIAVFAAQVSAFASTARIFRVNSGGSYVRSESGEKIGSLRKGTRVLYWGHKRGQMLKVMIASGKVGYVYQGNLEPYGAMNSKQLYMTNSSATLYKRVGSSMKRKGSVGKGVPLIMYRSVNGWALVKSLAGKSAFIKTSELKKIS